MFKNWGTWLGIEGENDKVEQESDEEKIHKINKRMAAAESEHTATAAAKDAEPTQVVNKAKSLSGKFDQVSLWTL